MTLFDGGGELHARVVSEDFGELGFEHSLGIGFGSHSFDNGPKLAGIYDEEIACRREPVRRA